MMKIMGTEGAGNIFQNSISTVDHADDIPINDWKIKEGDYDICHSESTTSCFEDSTSSIGSISSSDLLDDASSSSFSSSSSSSSSPPSPPSLFLLPNGPLYELSELMDQLPIKRGLSKYFQGKSQSFTCLSNARCIEDLAKKVIPCGKRAHKLSHSPKTTISKKAARSSFPSLLAKRGSFGLPSTV